MVIFFGEWLQEEDWGWADLNSSLSVEEGQDR